MSIAPEIYDSRVRTLPRSERLRLAALILGELSTTAAPDLDYSDSWTAEDIRDLTAFSSQQAIASYPEGDELV